MILSEEQSLQLAAILIEAAEENGTPKTTLINKIKKFIKDAIEWVKSKLKKFKEFLSKKFKLFDVFFKGFDKILKELDKVVTTRTYKDKRVKTIKSNNVREFYVNLTKSYSDVLGFSEIASNSILNMSDTERDMTLNRLRGSIEDLKQHVDTYSANIDRFTEEFRAKVDVNINFAVREARGSLLAAKKVLQDSNRSTKSAIKRIDAMTANLEDLGMDIAVVSGRLRTGGAILVRETMVVVGNSIRVGIVFIKAVFRVIKMVASPIVEFFKNFKKGKEEKTTSGNLLPALV